LKRQEDKEKLLKNALDKPKNKDKRSLTRREISRKERLPMSSENFKPKRESKKPLPPKKLPKRRLRSLRNKQLPPERELRKE